MAKYSNVQKTVEGTGLFGAVIALLVVSLIVGLVVLGNVVVWTEIVDRF